MIRPDGSISIHFATKLIHGSHPQNSRASSVLQKATPISCHANASAKAASDEEEVESRSQQLHDVYKEQAIRALRGLDNANLKGLLRRVMTKIFDDLKIEGWCREYETRNAASGSARPEPVA